MKKIIVDTNILIYLMNKNAPTDNLLDVDGFTRIDNGELRAKALLEHIEVNGGAIVIPTPVLAEYLLGIQGEKNKHLHTQAIMNMSCFEVLSFEEMAAIECASLPSLKEFKQMIKSELNMSLTASKVRFDRQIIAIAKANNITEIWSCDGEIYRKSAEIGIEVKSLSEILPLSEQFKLNLSDECSLDKRH